MARDPRNDDPSPGGEAGSEPFLSRWSRLKRTGAASSEPKPSEEPEAQHAQSDPEAPEADLTDEDMPDLDTIGEGSDISPFFSPGVSESLRQSALKRLFRSPKFNLRDGLDDYDGDFRSFQALGDVVTSEMRRQRERAEERLRARLAEAERQAAPDDGDQAEGGPRPSETHADNADDDSRDDGGGQDGVEQQA